MDETNWVGTYILDEQGNPKPCSTMEWALWFENSVRHIAKTDVGVYWVSTVFLGLDHSWAPMLDPLLYKPVLWETAVMDWTRDGHVEAMWRYSSREEALAGHERMVKICLEAMERHESLQQVEQRYQDNDRLGDAVPRLGDGEQRDDPADQAGQDQHDQNRNEN